MQHQLDDVIGVLMGLLYLQVLCLNVNFAERHLDVNGFGILRETGDHSRLFLSKLDYNLHFIF